MSALPLRLLLFWSSLRAEGEHPAAQQLVKEMISGLERVVSIVKFHLLIECVTLKPIKQALTVGGNYCQLRVVDMCVDEARADYLPRIFVNPDTIIEFTN